MNSTAVEKVLHTENDKARIYLEGDLTAKSREDLILLGIRETGWVHLG